jgi:hypothetical protein
MISSTHLLMLRLIELSLPSWWEDGDNVLFLDNGANSIPVGDVSTIVKNTPPRSGDIDRFDGVPKRIFLHLGFPPLIQGFEANLGVIIEKFLKEIEYGCA